MKGEIKYLAHTVHDDADVFFTKVHAHLQTCAKQKLEADVQYQTSFNPTGKESFSALILGRQILL